MGAYRRWAAEVRAWAADHDGWIGRVNPVEVWSMCALTRRTISLDQVIDGSAKKQV